MNDPNPSTHTDKEPSSFTPDMLLDMYRKLKAAGPRENIEAVLITHILYGCWKARHEGKIYLIIGTAEWVRIQSVVMQPDPIRFGYPTELFGLSMSLFGIPVIEDEELVRAICGEVIEWFRHTFERSPFSYWHGA